jgi:hypothetical protein
MASDEPAAWNLIPLLGLVIATNLRERFVLPGCLHAVGENIADIRRHRGRADRTSDKQDGVQLLRTISALKGYRNSK